MKWDEATADLAVVREKIAEDEVKALADILEEKSLKALAKFHRATALLGVEDVPEPHYDIASDEAYTTLEGARIYFGTYWSPQRVETPCMSIVRPLPQDMLDALDDYSEDFEVPYGLNRPCLWPTSGPVRAVNSIEKFREALAKGLAETADMLKEKLEDFNTLAAEVRAQRALGDNEEVVALMISTADKLRRGGSLLADEEALRGAAIMIVSLYDGDTD